MDRSRNLVRHSLWLRHVDCGSCNACESELAMLFSQTYDAQRYGIEMAASPRHADGISVAGPVTMQMERALERTYEAVGEPRLVVAVGDCAIGSGVHVGGYAVKAGAAAKKVPVTVAVPGCPPSPGTILQALRAYMAGGVDSENESDKQDEDKSEEKAG